MGVLQRFERRLEGLVEGTFARMFKGDVQPVEIAAALQREAEDKKAIVGAGRVLVPNAFVVELGPSDAERLGPYDQALRSELATMVDEHAREQGWSFVGPVDIRFEPAEGLATGIFRVRSSVAAREGAAAPARGGGSVAVAPTGGTGAQLVLSGPDGERVVALTAGVLVVGRGSEAGLQLGDTGVSRRHAEFRVADSGVTLVDLNSTNGTTVNGRRVTTAQLRDGDRIGIGNDALVFRAGA